MDHRLFGYKSGDLHWSRHYEISVVVFNPSAPSIPSREIDGSDFEAKLCRCLVRSPSEKWPGRKLLPRRFLEQKWQTSSQEKWLWIWVKNGSNIIHYNPIRSLGLITKHLPNTCVPLRLKSSLAYEKNDKHHPTSSNQVTGWWYVYLPLWKIYEFVSWDDEIPNIYIYKHMYIYIYKQYILGKIKFMFLKPPSSQLRSSFHLGSDLTRFTILVNPMNLPWKITPTGWAPPVMWMLVYKPWKKKI